MRYLRSGKESQVFNLGNNNVFFVRQIIDAAKAITQKPIKVVECDRRLGDPPILVGNTLKARQVLGWKPQYTKI